MGSERTCIECKKFDIQAASKSWSEATPGNDFQMRCSENKWTFSKYDWEEEFRACLQTAAKCESFVQRGRDD